MPTSLPLSPKLRRELVFMDSRCLDYVLQEAFEFKKPVRPVSRGCLHSHGLQEGKDLFAQRQNSAPAWMVCALAFIGDFLIGRKD